MRSVGFSPNGERIAGDSDDRIVRVWDTANGQLMTTLTDHNDWIRVVVYSANGAHIASGSDDCTVRLWNAQTGACFAELEQHSQPITFSPDGNQIKAYASASTRVWDIENHRTIFRKTFLENRSECTAFPPTFTLDESRTWLLASRLPGDGHWHIVHHISDSDRGCEVSSWGCKAVIGTENGNMCIVDCSALFGDPILISSSLPQSHFAELY
jgi:WD40 repeat protein